MMSRLFECSLKISMCVGMIPDRYLAIRAREDWFRRGECMGMWPSWPKENSAVLGVGVSVILWVQTPFR